MLENYFLYRSLKRLAFNLKHCGGRNLLGRICVFHRGGASRKRCCRLDLIRRIQSFGLVCRLFRESLRTSFTALILYRNGLFSFISAAQGAGLGATLYSGKLPEFYKQSLAPLIFVPGSALPLESINLFNLVHNVELFAFSGFKIARAAGANAVLSNKMPGRCFLKLSSGWTISVARGAFAVLGSSSNVSHKYYNFSRAGKRRAFGFRPVVRGVAKNPCDHPHGGGEGKSSPPRAAVSPWGRLTKGTPSTNKLAARLKRRHFKTSR